MRTLLAVIGGIVVFGCIVSFLMSLGGYLVLQAQEAQSMPVTFVEVGGVEPTVGHQGQSDLDLRPIGCELLGDDFPVTITRDQVTNVVVAYRGAELTSEPHRGANQWFKEAGCQPAFETHWRLDESSETFTIWVKRFSDWPTEEAVLAALEAGQPVYGILDDCGNPVVLNATQLPALTVPAEPTSAFWSPGQFAPTATIGVATLVPVNPTRQAPAPQRDLATPAAPQQPEPQPTEGGCSAWEGGICPDWGD